MGQQIVYEFLEEHPNVWFSSKEISKSVKLSLGSVTTCLKRLREKNEVRYKISGLRSGKRPQYLYAFKN